MTRIVTEAVLADTNTRMFAVRQAREHETRSIGTDSPQATILNTTVCMLYTVICPETPARNTFANAN